MTRKNQRTLTTAIVVILAFAACIGTVSFIGKKTNGFMDDITIDALTQRDLNEDNLYKADLLTIGETYNPGNGITLKTKSDGVIILDGKLGGDTAVDIKVASIDLAAGTYTFTTDAKTGLYSAYMYATADNGTTKLAFDFGGNNADGTFELAATSSYDIYIHVEPDVAFNDLDFCPTIVTGDEAGEFYAE